MPRKMHLTLLLISSLLVIGFIKPIRPEVLLLTGGTKTSLRGLSVVNDNVVWVSGSNGMVGRSNNAGKSWNWMTVKGFEKTEFRDIEAFDANTAIIMAIAEPAYILKTINGGETWKVVYQNNTKGMFLDAMDFASPLHGMVVGDPINDTIFLAETTDGGNTWNQKRISGSHAIADSGEAFFAASGSNIRLFNNNEFFIVSGGMKSRLIERDHSNFLPIIQGKQTSGANAIDIFDEGQLNKPGNRIVIVGGDFAADSLTAKNCIYSADGGKTWQVPTIPPNGYRSCVEYLSKKQILACGLNGVDYSTSGGKTWTSISKEGFHVCRIARTGTAVFLAGNNGKIGKLIWK